MLFILRMLWEGARGGRRRRKGVVSFFVVELELELILFGFCVLAQTMDFPSLNPKRSTLSVLGSPVVLSGPSQPNHFHPTHGTSTGNTTNRRLTSPVVGEFKGWFSNLFNWKHNSGTGVLYSPDDVTKTRGEVGRLLQGLGVIVQGWGFSSGAGVGIEGGKGVGEEVLRCRVEGAGVDALTGLDLKPVRFRIEFSAASNNTGANPSSNLLATPTPLPNANFVGSPKPSSIPRGRASTLMNNRSPNASSYPSPNLGAIAFPPGCTSAIVMVQEKGSASTFRAVWRKLKEVYGDEHGSEGAGYPCLSPAMGSTPLMEHAQRFAV